MGKLTNYIGGQIVTDNGVTGERNFIVQADDDARVVGNLYLTPSEVANAVELTGFFIQGGVTSVAMDGSESFVVVVTGDEGATYTFSTSDGASVSTGPFSIQEGETSRTHTIAVSANDTNSTRNPSVTITRGVSDPETVDGDGFTTPNTVSVSQDSRIETTCTRTSGNPLSGVSPSGGTIVFQGTWDGDGTASISLGGSTDEFGSLSTSGGGGYSKGDDVNLGWFPGDGSLESISFTLSVSGTATHQPCTYTESRTSF